MNLYGRFNLFAVKWGTTVVIVEVGREDPNHNHRIMGHNRMLLICQKEVFGIITGIHQEDKCIERGGRQTKRLYEE